MKTPNNSFNLKMLFLSILLTGMASYTQAQSGTGGKGKSFIPDVTFSGSDLVDWQTLGKATWKAKNGSIHVSSKKEDGFGILLNKNSFQDIGFRSLFSIDGQAELGFLFRFTQIDSGYAAVMISVAEGELQAFNIHFDKKGNELKREELRYARGIIRKAPPKPEPSENENNGQRRGDRRRPAGPEIALPLERPSNEYQAGEWNQLEVFMDLDMVRTFLNDGSTLSNAIDELGDGYGSFGIYISGKGAASIDEFAYKDLSIRFTPKEASASRFTVQRISDMFYAWSSTAADFNNDGHTDIASGPYIYFGPDYTHYREVYPGFTYNPSSEFPITNCEYSFDFNQDGWTDIMIGAPIGTIYMNPGKESRRWSATRVIPAIQSEVTVFQDIDGDGLPELIYGANREVRFARYDPKDPTAAWTEYTVSEGGYASAHGIGAGDINGDGRIDIINPNGWWEQPAKLDGSPWTYHKVALSRYGHRNAGLGGSVMAVYDVNGDGMNDVVTSLNAHGFGLAWYEQTNSEDESKTFVEHVIMDDYSTDNAGDVTFSELHGSTFADIDGDGIPDFIVGKRYFSHLDNYFDPDPYGPPYIYVYKTVRDTNAPGGARFEPELVHNRSGVGSDVLAHDLNKDGKIDIVTATDRGTFIFWNDK